MHEIVFTLIMIIWVIFVIDSTLKAIFIASIIVVITIVWLKLSFIYDF